MPKMAEAATPLTPGQPTSNVDMGMMQTLQKQKAPPKREGVDKAKNDLRRIIQQVGIDPQRLIQAGKYAEAALRDKNMYPIAIQMAIKSDLISPEDVQPGGIDYRILSYGITAGKLTQELIDEGQL